MWISKDFFKVEKMKSVSLVSTNDARFMETLARNRIFSLGLGRWQNQVKR